MISGAVRRMLCCFDSCRLKAINGCQPASIVSVSRRMDAVGWRDSIVGDSLVEVLKSAVVPPDSFPTCNWLTDPLQLTGGVEMVDPPQPSQTSSSGRPHSPLQLHHSLVPSRLGHPCRALDLLKWDCLPRGLSTVQCCLSSLVQCPFESSESKAFAVNSTNVPIFQSITPGTGFQYLLLGAFL